MEKKPVTHIIAGLILAAVMIAYSLVLHFANLSQQSGLQWIAYLVMVAGIIYFVNRYGNVNNNTISFGGLFGYGFKTTAIMTLAVIFYTILFFALFPEVKEKMFDIARQSMEEQNKMSEEDIDKAITMVKKFFWVFTIGGVLLTYAIIGAIASLIGAAITKKKPYNPLDQLDAR